MVANLSREEQLATLSPSIHDEVYRTRLETSRMIYTYPVDISTFTIYARSLQSGTRKQTEFRCLADRDLFRQPKRLPNSHSNGENHCHPSLAESYSMRLIDQ
jgi:hypothetical protein